VVDVGASVGTIDRDIGSERLPAFAAKDAKTSAATVAVVLKFSVQFPNFINNSLILECALPYGKSGFPDLLKWFVEYGVAVTPLIAW
jgi:hypothetical protein